MVFVIFFLLCYHFSNKNKCINQPYILFFINDKPPYYFYIPKKLAILANEPKTPNIDADTFPAPTIKPLNLFIHSSLNLSSSFKIELPASSSSSYIKISYLN